MLFKGLPCTQSLLAGVTRPEDDPPPKCDIRCQAEFYDARPPCRPLNVYQSHYWHYTLRTNEHEDPAAPSKGLLIKYKSININVLEEA